MTRATPDQHSFSQPHRTHARPAIDRSTAGAPEPHAQDAEKSDMGKSDMGKSDMGKSAVIKRSVIIGGHKTSISLEDAFWSSLKDIARHRGLTLSTLVAAIDGARKNANLSSAIRLFVLDHFRTRALNAVLIGQRIAAPAAHGDIYRTRTSSAR